MNGKNEWLPQGTMLMPRSTAHFHDFLLLSPDALPSSPYRGALCSVILLASREEEQSSLPRSPR